ncbi:hypothetical protein H311_00385, partial [Anncaliia algerae PRA109]
VEEILKYIYLQTALYMHQWSSYLYFFKDNTDFNYRYGNHKLYLVDLITKKHIQNEERLYVMAKKFQSFISHFEKFSIIFINFPIKFIKYKNSDIRKQFQLLIMTRKFKFPTNIFKSHLFKVG